MQAKKKKREIATAFRGPCPEEGDPEDGVVAEEVDVEARKGLGEASAFGLGMLTLDSPPPPRNHQQTTQTRRRKRAGSSHDPYATLNPKP